MPEYTLPKSVAIISGSGLYPHLLAEGAHEAGVGCVHAICIKGSASKSSVKAADEHTVIRFGSLDTLRKAIAGSGCRHVLLAGQINPLSLFRASMDRSMKRELESIKIRNAHTLFKRLIEMIEADGVEVLPSSLFMARHIPSPGVLTQRAPDEREAADFDFGNRIAMEMCNLDIGQSVVVKDGVALAIEGFDGTNATIKRGGAIARKGAVLVKVAKNGHDMRFDIPVVGEKTLCVMKKARLSAMSVQAGRTIMINLPETVRLADKYGIAIQAVQSPYPSAPVFRPGVEKASSEA